MKIKVAFIFGIFLSLTTYYSNCRMEANIELENDVFKSSLNLDTVNNLTNKNSIKLENAVVKSDLNLDKLIPFSFENEELTEIINYLAKELKLNIILPQGPNAIQRKITFQPQHTDKVSLRDAWELMNMFLEIAGYTLALQGKFYVIVKKEADKTARHEYPLYIGTNPSQLPDTDQRIQYVYFLKNIQVPEQQQDSKLTEILKETLSTDSTILYDVKSNAIILNDKASNISSAMNIIVEFDQSGFQETIEFIHLYHSSAAAVAKILEDLIKSTQNKEDSPFIGQGVKGEASIAFPANTRVRSYGRTNSLIIMGRQTAVNRIKDFISKYIDVPQKSGESILHVYELQYLDAGEFATTLGDILKGRAMGAQSEGGQTDSGPERYFQGPPVVVAETLIASPIKGGGLLAQGGFKEFASITAAAKNGVTIGQLTESIQRGGNRIIVAALNSDWKIIKELIQKLDRPEPQVILEVMTISVDVMKRKLLGSTTRRRRGECFCPSTNRIEFLASNLTSTQNVLCNAADCPNFPPTGSASIDATLAADLLRLSQTTNPSSVAELFSATELGSTLISFKDSATNKIWAVLAALDRLSENKILNHPHIVTINNRPAQVAISETRRGRGQVTGLQSGVATIPFEDIVAPNLVQFVPRIASLDSLNLQLRINLTEFTDPIDPNNFQRRSRIIETNTNMNTSQVLAIGGLGRFDDNEAIRRTPILSRIPFIGQFFKYEVEERRNQDILILISPTIVHPKLRKGTYLYTADKIRAIRKKINAPEFLNDRDPVDRWFFGTELESDNYIRDYLEDVKNAPEFIELLSKQELKQAGLVRPKKATLPSSIEDPFEKERKLKQILAYEENPLANNPNLMSQEDLMTANLQ